ncbi:MAG: hypothetical protein V7722_04805 [Porticoccus sp.]
MLTFYQWLLDKLPSPLANIVMVGLYAGLILLVLSLADTRSLDFIYWDQ